MCFDRTFIFIQKLIQTYNAHHGLCRTIFLLLNFYPLKDLKDWIFPDQASQMYEGYLTAALIAWINARCVSFCLDRIWGRVKREEGFTSGLIMMSAYCFYLPLGIMGPLVTSKKFKDSFDREPSPLSIRFLSDAIFGTMRYFLWLCVTDISTYFTFQQAFTYHVS